MGRAAWSSPVQWGEAPLADSCPRSTRRRSGRAPGEEPAQESRGASDRSLFRAACAPGLGERSPAPPSPLTAGPWVALSLLNASLSDTPKQFGFTRPWVTLGRALPFPGTQLPHLRQEGAACVSKCGRAGSPGRPRRGPKLEGW